MLHYMCCNVATRSALQNIKCSISTIKYFHTSSARGTSASTLIIYNYDKDPAPAFLNPETQSLLKSITRMKFDKVFRKKSVNNNTVEYKFMTTEQVEQELKNIVLKAEKLLQMPPIVKIKDEKDDIISKDPGLTDFDSSPYIFTDISFGLKNSERSIVMRHTNGILQNAPQEIRKRVNQIYFPLIGRSTKVPRMFQPEYLNCAFEQKQYEFILDRLCVQFEPFDKEFHEISAKVFLHINETKNFDLLRSTRHFGPMAFFLAWHKMIDDLVLDMIKRDYLRNAVQTAMLMFRLNDIADNSTILQELEKNPEPNNLIKEKLPGSDDIHSEIDKVVGKSLEELKIDGICLEFLQHFTKKHALKKVQLDLALGSYLEMYNQKRELAEGLRKAHGIN